VPSPRVTLPDPIPGWDDLRVELGVPDEFPPEVLAAAEQATPELTGEDLRDVPFLTIDPPGSVDLDQAMALSRTADGFLIQYAIADVAAFVPPGGPVDVEAHGRGQTLYAPDRRTPLHPPVISEDRASLLPDVDRRAAVWQLRLDQRGELLDAEVKRAIVRSRQQLDYATVQAQIDGGSAPEGLHLLQEIGQLRQAAARRRGAVDLPTPEQEVDDQGRITYRAPLPSEAWNAQISLLTGMAAAGLMLKGGIGLLRTLPVPPKDAVESLRRSAHALRIPWPDGAAYGDVISGLDPHQPREAALLSLATRLLRGAAYTAFDGEPPEPRTHSGVAAPYAHCTAPLRRLADRYAQEVCLSLCAGVEVPEWVRAALPLLPEEMAASDHRAHALDRAIVDLAEATALQHRVGEVFTGVVVESGHKGGVLQLAEPAVRGKLDAQDPPLGKEVRVRLELAEPATRSVRFVLV
jgi:exoribonuclease R